MIVGLLWVIIVMKLLNIFLGTLKIVIPWLRAQKIDREVFERLDASIPSVDTVDFCNFSKDHIRSLQADILMATDVV